MPTDISVSVDNTRRGSSRMWLAGPHGVNLPKHAVYDFTLFTHANFTATGYIPNGCLLGIVTATGKVGPYDDTATDGRQTAVGFAFNDTKIPTVNPAGAVVTDAYLQHCGVRVSGLPLKSGPGALDAAARVDLDDVTYYG